jgi:mono/diheme cytochrome c family protein
MKLDATAFAGPDGRARRAAGAIAAALAVLLAAGARAAEPAAGGVVVSQYCAICHAVGPGKTVSRNRKAPAFAVIAADPSTSEESLRATLGSPHASMVQVPLTAEQKDAAIRYILSLR